MAAAGPSGRRTPFQATSWSARTAARVWRSPMRRAIARASPNPAAGRGPGDRRGGPPVGREAVPGPEAGAGGPPGGQPGQQQRAGLAVARAGGLDGLAQQPRGGRPVELDRPEPGRAAQPKGGPGQAAGRAGRPGGRRRPQVGLGGQAGLAGRGPGVALPTQQLAPALRVDGGAGAVEGGQGLPPPVRRLLVPALGERLLAGQAGILDRPVGEGRPGEREVVGKLPQAGRAGGELLEGLAGPAVDPSPLTGRQLPVQQVAHDRMVEGVPARGARLHLQQPRRHRRVQRRQQAVVAEVGHPPEEGHVGVLADHGRDPEHVLDRAAEAGHPLADDPANALGHVVGGRPGGRLGDVPALEGARLGQVPQQLGHQERVAAGPLAEHVGQGRAARAERPGHRGRGHRGDLVAVQSPEGQQLGPGRADQVAEGGGQVGPGGPLVVPEGQDGQQPRRPPGVGQAAQQQQGGLVGAVQVVDQQQQRAGDRHRLQQSGERLEEEVRVGVGSGHGPGREGGQAPGQLRPEPHQLGRPGAEQRPQPLGREGGQLAADRLPQRQVGDAEVLVAASRQHHRAVLLGQGGQLGHQPGLADAGLAGHQHGPALAALRVGPGGEQPAQLRPPADEGANGRPRAGEALPAGRRAARGDAGRLGVEQLQVGGLQLGGRADPELLGQHPPVAVVGAQRLPTVAGGGVGAQQPPVGGVPERLEGDQVAGRSHGPGRVPRGQVDVDQQLQGLDVHLVEGGAAVLEPGAVVAGQQRPPGDGPGPLRRRRRLGEPALVQRPLGGVGLALGQLDVDRRVGGQDQPVAAGRAGQRDGRGDAEQLQEVPDLADHPAQGRSPGGRQRRPPHRLGQLLGRHRAVTLGHQVGEHHRRLPPRQVGRVGLVAVGLGRQLAGQGDLQWHGIAAGLRLACVLRSTVSRAVNRKMSGGFGRAGSSVRTQRRRRTPRGCSPRS